MKQSLLIPLVIIAMTGFSQTHDDSQYYQHWVGEWYQFQGDSLKSTPTFIVKQGLYNGAFEEYWLGAGGNFSKAWRAWDHRTEQWEFAWMSTDGLFQLWQGRKVGNIWYMYKTFIVNGQEVLSRQAFIPNGDRELIRTSEHSRDGGSTWTLRFREVYRKRL